MFPHSAAGLEALRWAQMYPDEIAGIVGMDMAIPQAVLDSQYSSLLLKFVNIFAFMGVHRLFGVDMMNGMVDLSAIETKLTTHDKYQMRLLFNRTMYKNIDKEAPLYPNIAQLVEDCGIPSKPMILFSSSKFEMMGSKPGSWLKHKEHFSIEHNVPLTQLDGGHLLMSEQPEIIASQANDFIAGILNEPLL